MRLLIVDDEAVALTSVKRLLRRLGMRNVETCDNGVSAAKLIKESEYDIVLLDLLMPDMDGLQVLETTKPFKPQTEFILLTAVDDISTAIKAIQLGAYDYLVKPVNNERLMIAIEHAYERKGLKAGLAGARSEVDEEKLTEVFPEIITQSPRMKELLSYTSIMARSGNPILITGESGTGKELLARGIHRAGPSPDGPFIPVNVSSIPETLFVSHFFGHAKGAFTGADSDHKGFFEQAHGGTLFLDEIGELPMYLQAKLLRVLEEKELTRLGETKSIHVNARIVSATNVDVDAACREGKFRLDLLYRLKSAQVHLPPLRERRGDIPLLVSHFVRLAAERHGKDVRQFSHSALSALNLMDFPGNIRELAQLVENAVILAGSETIDTFDIGAPPSDAPSFGRTMCTLKENDEIHTVFVLQHTKGDTREAARILGVTIRQVQRKLSQIKQNPKWKSILDDI